jgi:hypothetical protein
MDSSDKLQKICIASRENELELLGRVKKLMMAKEESQRQAGAVENSKGLFED